MIVRESVSAVPASMRKKTAIEETTTMRPCVYIIINTSSKFCSQVINPASHFLSPSFSPVLSLSLSFSLPAAKPLDKQMSYPFASNTQTLTHQLIEKKNRYSHFPLRPALCRCLSFHPHPLPLPLSRWP